MRGEGSSNILPIWLRLGSENPSQPPSLPPRPPFPTQAAELPFTSGSILSIRSELLDKFCKCSDQDAAEVQ